jgi:hypothetical protein
VGRSRCSGVALAAGAALEIDLAMLETMPPPKPVEPLPPDV